MGGFVCVVSTASNTSGCYAACMSVCLSVCLSACLPACLPAWPQLKLEPILTVCLSTYFVLTKGL